MRRQEFFASIVTNLRKCAIPRLTENGVGLTGRSPRPISKGCTCMLMLNGVHIRPCQCITGLLHMIIRIIALLHSMPHGEH